MVGKGAGRRRIPMKKIEKESSLQVTFSKRRYSIYRKASELSVLCGSHVAIIISSAMNKFYAFGDSNAEQILSSFINRDSETNNMIRRLMENHRVRDLCELEREIVDYEAIIKAENTRKKSIDEVLPDNSFDKKCFEKLWFTPEEELTLAEAEEMLVKLEEFEQFMDFSGAQMETSFSGVPLNCFDPDLASTSYVFEHNRARHLCGTR